MEKKVLIEKGEFKRLMDRQKEAEESGKIFYSERQSHSSEAVDTRKMAIDFLESKLLNDEKGKTEDKQNNDLQLMNIFFQEEIGYLNRYYGQNNLTITANTLKDTFIRFLRSGREADLTHQELTLLVNIIDDVQVLMEDENSGKKNANSINRLNKMEQNNPKLVNEMKAATTKHKKRATEIKKGTTKVNENQMRKSAMQFDDIQNKIENNNINIDNFNKDFGKINLNNNNINMSKINLKPLNNDINIKKSNNNIIHNYNIINNECDRDDEKKEDNIDENLKIDDFIKRSTNKNQKSNIKEEPKFKKIDVKKSNNIRLGNQINRYNLITDTNIKKEDDIKNNTFVGKRNTEQDFKNKFGTFENMNPKTKIVKKPKTKIIKPETHVIGNQSMIVPNNMTSNTNVGGNKKASDIMQNMLSKKSINKQNDNNINNNI